MVMIFLGFFFCKKSSWAFHADFTGYSRPHFKEALAEPVPAAPCREAFGVRYTIAVQVNPHATRRKEGVTAAVLAVGSAC